MYRVSHSEMVIFNFIDGEKRLKTDNFLKEYALIFKKTSYMGHLRL